LFTQEITVPSSPSWIEYLPTPPKRPRAPQPDKETGVVMLDPGFDEHGMPLPINVFLGVGGCAVDPFDYHPIDLEDLERAEMEVELEVRLSSFMHFWLD
jgi:hypothetical protein